MNVAAVLQILAGLLQHALILFLAQENPICNKIKQNIYFIAAFILFIAYETIPLCSTGWLS